MENKEYNEKEIRIQQVLTFLKYNVTLETKVLEKIMALLMHDPNDAFLNRMENAERVYKKGDAENKRHGIMLLENIISDVKGMME